MNYYTGILLSCFFFCSYSAELPELDALAIKYGTDKGPQWHNYTPIYDHYFHAKKGLPITLLEIGFWQGASMRMWDSYFTHPDTHLYSIDFNDAYFSAITLCSSRCAAYKADQEKPADLYRVMQSIGCNLDIIIDDGGHSMNQQITSFKTLFPYLKPGGIYIIEDLHSSYWQEYGSLGSCEEPQASPSATIRFLQALVDDVNAIGARTACADPAKVPLDLQAVLSVYQKNIKANHFYSSLCIIEKI